MDFEELPNPLEALGDARDWTEHQAARVIPGVVDTAADVYATGQAVGDTASTTAETAVGWGERQVAAATPRAVELAADVYRWMAD